MRHVSPSHASPAARTLQLLTRRYGVGEPLSCVPLDRGLLNRGYRLATTRGAYFLKHHLGGDPQTVLPLASRHRATAALADRGIPVVPTLADRSGDSAALLDGCCFVLHPWLDGRHREGGELDVADAGRLGDLLGRVHRQLELVIREDRAATAVPGNAHHLAPLGPGDPLGPHDHHAVAARDHAVPDPGTGAAPGATRRGEVHAAAVAPARAGHRAPAGGRGRTALGGGVHRLPGPCRPAPRPEHTAAPGGDRVLPSSPGTVGESARIEDTYVVIDQLLARIRRAPRRTSFDELAEHRLQERRGMLRTHAHHRPGPAQVPAAGWVHGDFHPLNLMYGEDSVEPLAIIDWDRLAIRPRAEEAVRAAAIFFLRPDGTLDLDKVRAYARAYRTATEADGDELAAATQRVWWERLNDFWMLRWHYELRDHRADPQFAAAASLIVWWTRNAAAVRDAFSG